MWRGEATGGYRWKRLITLVLQWLNDEDLSHCRGRHRRWEVPKRAEERLEEEGVTMTRVTTVVLLSSLREMGLHKRHTL